MALCQSHRTYAASVEVVPFSFNVLNAPNQLCFAFCGSPAVLASDRSTGPLGHKTKDQALACLQSCPLLEDMASWSHWDLVFKPELKELKDFVQKYGGAQIITVTGTMQ